MIPEAKEPSGEADDVVDVIIFNEEFTIHLHYTKRKLHLCEKVNRMGNGLRYRIKYNFSYTHTHTHTDTGRSFAHSLTSFIQMKQNFLSIFRCYSMYAHFNRVICISVVYTLNCIINCWFRNASAWQKLSGVWRKERMTTAKPQTNWMKYRHGRKKMVMLKQKQVVTSNICETQSCCGVCYLLSIIFITRVIRVIASRSSIAHAIQRRFAFSFFLSISLFVFFFFGFFTRKHSTTNKFNSIQHF